MTSRPEHGDLVERLRGIHRENERLFERLVAGEQRFRGLARAVWEVQEEERRRVAGELHDGLGQVLTALKIRLDRLDGRAGASDPELAAEIAAASGMAAEALAEARRLAHLLRPRVLDDLGLAAALRWLARTLGEWTGFDVALEIEGVGDERLRPEIETLAFRVAQEALTNAMKHSGADGARVHLVRADGRLRLRIADAGRGFDPRAVLETSSEGVVAACFGLAGLRERVELAGGRVELVSAPGEGTEVAVELPLAGDAGAAAAAEAR